MLTLPHLATDRQAERERQIRATAPAPANAQLALAHPVREPAGSPVHVPERLRPRPALGTGG